MSDSTDEVRAYTVRLELVDEPGELLRALEPIADNGGNLLSIFHERGNLTPRGHIPVEVDLEATPERFDVIVDALRDEDINVIQAGAEAYTEELTDLLLDQYEAFGMMHDLDIQYLAFLMTINSTKMTNENKRIVEWFEETFDEKGILTDHRAAFARAKKSQQSIYAHSESLRNDELERYDELLQLILEQTSPPTLGLDVEAAKAMTVEDIRAAAGDQEVKA
jgi:hypothetical protein